MPGRKQSFLTSTRADDTDSSWGPPEPAGLATVGGTLRNSKWSFGHIALEKSLLHTIMAGKIGPWCLSLVVWMLNNFKAQILNLGPKGGTTGGGRQDLGEGP